jgi:2'-5' RNA ligase
MATTHTTAAVIIPPRALWEPIQAIRRIHDRQIARWMPHITLLYPFRPMAAWDAAAAALRAACASVAPFTVTLARFRHFAHSPRSFTLWLEPDPAAPLARLQAALQADCPNSDAQSRFPAGFTPHLSVGQANDAGRLGGVMQELQAGWHPMRFDVEAVSLIARPEEGPFEEVRRVSLG